ncbi:DUF924 family protein [Bradyrhizobium sp. HKCCYLS20291]|uniref:DUF924 family protein n=1 Tax=Bradyrhizobium sp. HKCCYLS20291 TaxID=3420766 RepID=UPI003EC08E98
MEMPDDARAVLSFWFNETSSERWWQKDPAFDHHIRQEFSTLHKAATMNELFPWRHTIRGRLAEIIVLDQFSRNMYRGKARAFSHDAHALCLAQEAIRCADHGELRVDEKAFLYMPFMHSESLVIHEEARRLFSEPGLEEHLRYEEAHRALLVRFGRYPHRNSVLDRVSTREELAYLANQVDF